MVKIKKLKVKLFADGANKDNMIKMYNNPIIDGLTTNPTLMKKAGIKNYKEFAIEILKTIKNKPISFEVFSDDFEEMKKQALKIASWGDNVYVKIPITNTKGETSYDLVKYLSDNNIKTNITAIFTQQQVKHIIPALKNSPASYISIFAGRIADTGGRYKHTIKKTIDKTKHHKNIKVIWASCRETYNIIEANELKCDIITVNDNILNKLNLLNKNLNDFSLDTVKMFYNDAKESGYTI